MTPNGLDAVTGIMMVSSKNGLMTTARNFLVREVEVSSSNQIAVGELVDLLTSAGLAHYRFEEGGMGCRWWCTVVMQKLEEYAYVGGGTVTDLVKWWSDLAAQDSRVLSTEVKGTFY